jgi:hypothetical protein
VSKERITSVANQYLTNLWGVGGSQGRGAPSIEYRDRQKVKEQCVKTFCGEVDVVTSLREENAWDTEHISKNIDGEDRNLVRLVQLSPDIPEGTEALLTPDSTMY